MFLGIDIGTSGVKVVVTNDDSDVIEQAVSPLPVSRPHPSWSEQDPADWWKATQEAVLQLSPDRRAKIEAVGLSGQMHGATLLGAGDEVLRPAILWNDGRSAAQCVELERREPKTREITGNAVFPGFTAPKLLWVAENEPEVFSKVEKVLLPKDYVRLLMTGTYGSDMSDASGTSWLDVGKRAWSPAMLEATGLTEAHMPELFEGSDATGTLLPEVAKAWGMNAVPVAGGGGDNAAGAVGVGVTGPGDAFMSLGTSGVLFLAGEAFSPNPDSGVHAFCHALPGRWHEMTVMLSAASCLDWAMRLTGTPDAGSLVAAAEKKGRLDASLLFLPYLSGERTPHNDPHARGVLFGLDHDSGTPEVAQAVLEGVALAFADGLNVLRDPGRVSEVTVIGGGARSSYWGRILSAALDRPLAYRRDADVGPAYGAAKLAQLCLGNADADKVLAAPPVLSVVEPNKDDVAILAEKRERFSALYSTLKDSFPKGA
ncbi:xylulokinase [Parvularcula dongshanensis]|uniref:Xylulose kinase n=1 Tax=Parvularcula dongshanensis TaxID=1173995 RepID=A0A840I6Y7_9PROT|nr:xylulokinase [Parvularcula dongshanensis]MBB4659934.1 xylulokinase [Parvularcula dongshanensis]